MNCTLKGNFYLIERENRGNVAKFLEKRRFMVRKKEDGTFSENATIHIELKETPAALQRLRNTAYYDNMEELNLNIYQVDIMDISELGILLYFAHNDGDNQLFIPMNQVICFHDFDKDRYSRINFESQNDEDLDLVKR